MKMGLLPVVALAVLLLLHASAHAQRGGRGGGGGDGGVVERREGAIAASGLLAAFPAGRECAGIASPFGSRTRYDGSVRRGDRFGGLHGGIDLSLPEGTPLLAVAAGTVIAKGQGGQMEGNFLWLRHPPEATGQPFWTFTKYQHLAELPDLDEGSAVKVGQVVAKSGRTGTVGGHYGAAGYPHLHLTTSFGPSAEFERAGASGSMVRGREARLDDPLMLYRRGATDPALVQDLPPAERQVRIAVVDEEGVIDPAGSLVVWPVACAATGGSK